MELQKFETVIELLKANIPLAKQISFTQFSNDNVYYLHIEALEEKDYPNKLSDNGRFLNFDITFLDGKGGIVYDRGGHVWLSPSDLQTEEYKYYAMRPISSLAAKKFRKCGYKSTEELVKKISTYANEVFTAMEKYTGGYPYERGI